MVWRSSAFAKAMVGESDRRSLIVCAQAREQRDLFECSLRLSSCIGLRLLNRLLPQRANWLVIVCCVGSHGQAVVFVSGNNDSIAHFPLGNFESGYAKRSQIRPRIVGNNAKIFAD